MQEATFNKPLGGFRGVHEGGTAILFATGPSVKKYNLINGSEEFIKVGVNRIYNYPEIVSTLDYYLFGSHYNLDKLHRENIDRVCRKYSFTKLASAYEDGTPTGRGNISPEQATEIGAIPFENNVISFSNDIAKYSTFGRSITFPALQFILYTGVSRIYLVGCDIVGTYGEGFEKTLRQLWKRFASFKEEYYPEVDIVSINPVGLRGVFIDGFTE